MMLTLAVDFPRLFELYSDSDKASKANYFANFENAINVVARQQYRRLEEDLQQLDDNAWMELKKKAAKYIAARDENRGWEQLFNTLSEVKGYLRLKSKGCTEVCFIPEKNTKTPDLFGRCGSSGILMEVKTINKSDDELDWIEGNSREYRNWKEGKPQRMRAREVRTGLDDPLKSKIVSTVKTAKEQLTGYSCNETHRKIVFLIINPDWLLDLDSKNIGELVTFIEEQGNNQIEIEHCFGGWKT